MGFNIFIETEYIDVEAFYPAESWDQEWEEMDWREDEAEVAYRALIERCISVDLSDKEELEGLMDVITDPAEGILRTVAVACSGCDAKIKVDDVEIQNPFNDCQSFGTPEPSTLIPDIVSLKFCALKVWENSGGLVYYSDCDDDFDVSKLTWERGKFAYDGGEFEFTDGDGSSSYTYFYKDGEVIG